MLLAVTPLTCSRDQHRSLDLPTIRFGARCRLDHSTPLMDHLVHLQVRSRAPLKGTLMHTFSGAHARCSLTKSPDRREVIIPDATHWVLYERNRDVLLTQTEKSLGSTRRSTPSDDLAKCPE